MLAAAAGLRPAFSALADARPTSPGIVETVAMRGMKKYRRSESDRMGLALEPGSMASSEDIEMDDVPQRTASSVGQGYPAMRQKPMAFHTSIDEEAAWPDM